MILGSKSTTGVTNPLTEEQLGGTTPEPGAVATVADQAPEETVAATAADEPATTVAEPTASSTETTVDSEGDALAASAE